MDDGAPMKSKTTQDRPGRAKRVINALKEGYPNAECALQHRNAFELLVATILSAQCTDERVNQVTPLLFEKYPSPARLAAAALEDIEKIIQSTGFFRNKAKNIKECARGIHENHGGEVPSNLDSLTKLAGVGRKTANVVLGVVFDIASGVVVDTHVARLSQRLGLTDQTDPAKIEMELMEIVPKEEWIDFSHRLIHHGRRVCDARKPDCDACSMKDFCPKVGVTDPDNPKPKATKKAPERDSKRVGLKAAKPNPPKTLRTTKSPKAKRRSS